MDIVKRLRNFETTNVDLLFLKNDAALEIERLREALNDMIQFVRKEYGSNDVRVQRAEAVLKEKE